MKFYGLPESICKWKAIIETEFGITCSKVKAEPDRSANSASFEAELSMDNRDWLEVNYWYKIEDGQTSPWNWRVSFSE